MKTMSNLGKSFIVGGLIGMAVTKIIEPMQERTMSKRMRFGMKKFFRAMTAMKRLM